MKTNEDDVVVYNQKDKLEKDKVESLKIFKTIDLNNNGLISFDEMYN